MNKHSQRHNVSMKATKKTHRSEQQCPHEHGDGQEETSPLVQHEPEKSQTRMATWTRAAPWTREMRRPPPPVIRIDCSSDEEKDEASGEDGSRASTDKTHRAQQQHDHGHGKESAIPAFSPSESFHPNKPLSTMENTCDKAQTRAAPWTRAMRRPPPPGYPNRL